jgi:hypothetical protein
MAGEPVVHIGENSPEHVAFRLYQIIAFLEGRTNSAGFAKDGGGADRRYILDTYAECLECVKGYRARQS